MIAAILNISAEALQVEVRAPPPVFFPWDLVFFKEVTILWNEWLVQVGRPRVAMLLWALRPPKELSPSMWDTLDLVFIEELRMVEHEIRVVGRVVAIFAKDEVKEWVDKNEEKEWRISEGKEGELCMRRMRLRVWIRWGGWWLAVNGDYIVLFFFCYWMVTKRSLCSEVCQALSSSLVGPTLFFVIIIIISFFFLG